MLLAALHYFSTISEAQAFIAERQKNQRFDIVFAGRGTRKALCTGKNRNGKTMIQTWDATNAVWKKPRPMTLDDVLVPGQYEFLRINGRA